MTRALVAMAAVLVLAGPARAEPAMWTLRDADTTVTLLGAMHALPPGVPWRGPGVDAVIAEADLIVFEMRQDGDPASALAAERLMQDLGCARDGVSLSSRLTPAGRARLARHAPAAGLSPEALEGLQPWYAAFQLEWAGGRRDGARPELGVERTILAGLTPRQRTDALESSTDVVRMLSDYSESDQLRMLEGLLEALDDPEALKRNARALEAEWAAGGLARVAAESERLRAASPAVHDQLVTARNRRWAERLDGLLAQPGRVLVVVGAGHLVGPEGLPALLRARGLAVEGP